MASYDPKRRRARPTLRQDEPAPVEALLGEESRPTPGLRVAAASHGATASSTISVTEPLAGPEPDDTPVAELHEVPSLPSEQSTGTTAAASSPLGDPRRLVAAGVVALLLVLLLVWRRRSNG